MLAGTIGSYLSPGTSHNPFVAKMAGMDVMEFIGTHTYYSLMCGAILVVGTAVVCFLMGDGKAIRTPRLTKPRSRTKTSRRILSRLSCRSFRS
mgnify:CR=1 FL=1